MQTAWYLCKGEYISRFLKEVSLGRTDWQDLTPTRLYQQAEDIQNKEQKSSYRGIFKATSLFGGVQVYQILIEIIKSKFIAVLLGPVGVGIHGLYTSGTQMIQQLSSFGLSQSAVRNVAEAYGSGDNTTISKNVTALRRLVWLTGILGMLAVIAFSPRLSQNSFGDNAHIWGFVALSITLLFTQINAGQKVFDKYYQGMKPYGVETNLTEEDLLHLDRAISKRHFIQPKHKDIVFKVGK